MYEFGEEVIIESYKVPWLIWIQLLVMILLFMLLFYGFTISSLDVSNTASSSSTSTQSHLNTSTLNNINGSSRNTTAEEIRNIKGNAGASTSREITAEQSQERGESSNKDSVNLRPLSEHPCHYLGLAKQAFLKCLGLDSSERAPDKRHLKKD